MIQKVRNSLEITCKDIDFTTCTDLLLFVQQGEDFYREYELVPVEAHRAVVAIPKSDAMELSTKSVSMQFAVTNSLGEPIISDIEKVEVRRFLGELGYGDN